MVDINTAVYNMLKDIARVEFAYPDVSVSFPLITMMQSGGSADYVVEGQELISDITYQIDVWDKSADRQGCEQVAQRVSRALTKGGFKRTKTEDMKDGGIHRKSMEFSVKVINEGI